MNKRFTLIGIFCLALLAACTKKSEDQITPPPPPAGCDTLSMTYTDDIKKIIEDNTCLNCHSAQLATAGIILDNYTAVKNNADKIKDAISWPSHQPPSKRMPPSPGQKLDQCDIDKFIAWMNQGKVE